MKQRFFRHKLGVGGMYVVLLFALIGVYAPFLASSKPLAVVYEGHWYFPLFRYLFYKGFYTKQIDLFFNLLMFTLPLMAYSLWRRNARMMVFCVLLQLFLFIFINLWPIKNPTFQNSTYTTLNEFLEQERLFHEHQRITASLQGKPIAPEKISTLWNMQQEHRQRPIDLPPRDVEKISFKLMPLLRAYHWEEDVGGDQEMNQQLPWWDLSRINRKDLVAALLFGTRISLVVGLLAVSIALSIGLPIGASAGYYGGVFDLLLCRVIEVWEAMPTFFMLLFMIAITQTKSIFLVISVVGLFGWTDFCSYMRGEFLKQRNLAYVDACRALGLHDRRIMFSHIFPNAIPPILTLLPFSIMAAIISEAGLSFLGLGEEGSCSWGVLMDEGRNAFPGESYLLWPPAILLTLLLISIALVGDALRDSLDPKNHS